MAQKHGCGMLFYNPEKDALLLFRRDDKSWIPYPNMLDLLGGGVDEGETPDDAMVREMAEELTDLRTGLPLSISDFALYARYIDAVGTEQSIYELSIDFEISDLELHEGRHLTWLTRPEAATIELAFGFHGIVREFFASHPAP